MADTDNLTRKGMGRPPGAQNKITKALKEMILEALDNAGGTAYLAEQAEKNPSAFLTLVGKILPMEVKAEHSGGTDNSLTVNFVKGTEDAG